MSDTAHTPHPVDELHAPRVRKQITYHVGRLLDLVEERDGEIPAGTWWDHAIAVAGHSPIKPQPGDVTKSVEQAALTTATIEIDEAVYPTATLTALETGSQAPEAAPPVVVDMDLAPVWRVVWALTACAITIAVLLVLGAAWQVMG